MNLPQRIVLALGAIIIAGMVLFPPWLFIFTEPASQSDPFLGKYGSGSAQSHGERRIERPAGYHFLFGQHAPGDPQRLGPLFGIGPIAPLRYVIIQIDVVRLMVQLGGVLVVTMLLTVLLKSRK